MAAKIILSFLSLALLLHHVCAGITLEVLQKGDLVTYPKEGCTVLMHFKGSLENGTVFYSNFGGKPYDFIIGKGEIPSGLEEGIRQMTKGEIANITVTPDMAFGDGIDGVVPANSTVSFVVYLSGVWKEPYRLYVDKLYILDKKE